MTIRLLLALTVAAVTLTAAERFDVVVYGGTAGGTMAAIAAARSGVSVALLEPGRHLGGMVSGGLGRTDNVRQEDIIGGLTRQFFERVGKHYGESISWTFEPKIAEQVFNDWVREAGVHVFFSHRLASVTKKGNGVASLRTENGAEFAATIFIDSSYEGDLMKAAGVSYAVGRESRALYGESLAGRREFLPAHNQFRAPLSPFGEGGKLLPYIQPVEKIGLPGEGDGKIQAYCFRICLTDREDNRLPLPRPMNYEPARFALVKKHLAALGESVVLRDFMGISKMPNGKTDINSGGPVSTNLLGASWEYPEASYERRRQIWDEHLTWAQGLLYFLANDPGVPANVRAEMGRYGLAKDEFLDTGHWPHQMYVREARRMLGEYVLTQHDLQKHRTKHDSIGVGGYNIDIREVQWVAVDVFRFPNVAKEVLMEGYVSMPVEPYEIPYRSLLPKASEADNLLVTSCISASHVAYSSFRMEPQYMLAGHAAGIAAAQSVRTSRTVHKIDISQLQTTLRAQNQILSVGIGGHSGSSMAGSPYAPGGRRHGVVSYLRPDFGVGPVLRHD
jgi:hypothetical protein